MADFAFVPVVNDESVNRVLLHCKNAFNVRVNNLRSTGLALPPSNDNSGVVEVRPLRHAAF